MDDEKLIVLVQSNDCIYNKYSSAYKLPDKKKAAWLHIAKEMEVPEEMCMKRWSYLRDRYAREKRQENSASGSGASFNIKWPLMSAMEFIAPHVIPRPMRSSKNISEESLFPLSVDCSNSSFSSESQSPLPSPIIVSSPNPSLSIAPPPSPATVPKRKRQSSEISNVDQYFLETLGVFKKLCETQKEKAENDESSPLHGFGKMIVTTIGSMSASNQLMAMQRVTSLVMDIKLQSGEPQAR